MDNSLSQQVKEETNGWGRKLSAFFTIVLMLQIAFFAIVVISEIAARESVLSMLTGRIASLKSDFVEQTRTMIDSPVESNSRINYKERHKEKLLIDIEFYEGLKHSLIFLIAQGSSSPNFSLGNIQQLMLGSLEEGLKRGGGHSNF